MKKLFALMALTSLVGLSSACALDGTVGTEEGLDEELAEQADNAGTVDKVIMPMKNGFGAVGYSAPGGSGNITYHGTAPVMTNPIKMYYIWYGNWAGNTATSILTDFANSIGGSPHWNMNTSYYQNINNVKTYVSGNVSFGGAVHMSTAPNGKKLTDNAIKTIVSNAIAGTNLDAGESALPKDTNGLYFVLTTADVTATSGFCTQYCGWHTYGTISSANIKYSFVGNADRCLSGCAMQTTSPNGNAGADAMVSIIAHELEEAATDPQLNAWYDSAGYENADKCAWTFGTTQTAPNGSMYNITLGSRNYLIQQNLKLGATQTCAMQ